MPEPPRPEAPWQGSPERLSDWYTVPFVLPFVVGIFLLASGAGLGFGSGHPTGLRELFFDGGIVVLLLAVASYLLLGMWLVPSAIFLGGVVLLGADSVVVHAGPLSSAVGTAFGVVGTAAVVAAFWSRRHPARSPG